MYHLTSHTDDILFSDFEKPQRPKWWQKKGFITAFILSVLWLIFLADYFVYSDWWSHRFELSPAELIGELGGLFLPIVVVFLVSAYFDRSEQLAYEARVLQSYLNELVYPTEEGAVYTQTLTDALKVQIKEFRKVFHELNEQTQMVRQDLKKWISDLSSIIDHVDTKTITSVQEIAGHIHNLAEVTEAATDQAEKVSASFSEQSVILQRVTKQTVDSMKEMTNTLSQNATDIKDITHAIENSNDRITGALDKADEVVKGFKTESVSIEKAIMEYEASAKQQNARLFGNLEKVLSVFRAHGDILNSEVEKTANRLKVVEGSFADQAKGLMDTANEAVKQLSEAGNMLETTSQKADQTLAGIQENMGVISSELGKNITQALQLMPNKPSNPDLLKDASLILDQLQAFSVDMAHIFTPKSEETLWQKYYSGDKAVFMRHIARKISETQGKKVQDLYLKDKDFNLAVNRYMAEFEGLTKSAREEGETNLLMSILIGSDAGRLYMVLADVLRKGD